MNFQLTTKLLAREPNPRTLKKGDEELNYLLSFQRLYFQSVASEFKSLKLKLSVKNNRLTQAAS
jgi:hypothetical protein